MGQSFGQMDSLKLIVRSSNDQTSILQASDLLVKGLAFKKPDSALFYGFNVFESALNTDTTTASSLSLNIGTAYYAKGNYDSALIFWQKAADLSRLTPEKQVEPLALNNVAVIYQNTGRIQDAIQNFAQAIDIYKKRGDTTRVGRGTFNIGKAYLALGEDSIGVHYIKKSIDIYSDLGDRALKNLANAYNELASVFYHDSEFPEALEYYQRSIRFYLQAGDTLGSLKPRGNIGNIHRTLGNSEEALGTYKEIIETKEKFRQFNVHFNYHNLGKVYDDLERHSEALNSYQKALRLREDAGLLGLTSSTLIGLAESFRDMGELDSAAYYYARIYETSKQLDEAEFRSSSICAYCDWLVFQGKLQESLPYILDCYQEANSINAKSLVVKASNWLQEIYELSGDYEKAHRYLKISSQLSDSLFNADLIREIAEKEAAFENEKELIERENAIMLLESKKQLADLRITLLLIGLILIVVAAFLVSRMMIMKRERKKRELEAIAKFRESMTGMIAHDLKTPLSVIMNSSSDEKSNKQMAGQMLQLINNMLDVHRFESTEVKLEKDNVSLQSLVEIAENHVGFLLKEKDLTLQVDADQDCILNVDKAIMVRVLVNLLTNAIKYSPFNEAIKITSAIKGEKVEIAISDKGTGISEEQKELIFKSFGQLDPKDSGGIGSTGLGLTFVKLALKAHQSDIQVNSKRGEGTKFSFELPLLSTSTIDVESIKQTQILRSPIEKIPSKRLEKLRSFNVHQIGEIEKELSEIKGKNSGVEQWIEHVLNSAYSGNEEKYKELLS